MKIDYKTIMIAALIAVVAALILLQKCGSRDTSKGIDIELVYDSLERVIVSKLPPPDTIIKINERTVTRWLPSATVRDTIYVDGSTVYVFNDVPIDTAAILTHYLTQAVTYTDTVEDSSLQAVIQDTIFRNKIVGRGFTYKWKQPTQIKYIDNRDKFQLIASLQAGAGFSYSNQLNGIYGGVDLGLKFRSGTYFSVGYMAGSSHFGTIRVGQVIRLKKPKLRKLL
jgi:hypothetical protein